MSNQEGIINVMNPEPSTAFRELLLEARRVEMQVWPLTGPPKVSGAATPHN